MLPLRVVILYDVKYIVLYLKANNDLYWLILVQKDQLGITIVCRFLDNRSGKNQRRLA